MKLKHVKLASLFFTIIPLVCFIMFSKTGNGIEIVKVADVPSLCKTLFK